MLCTAVFVRNSGRLYARIIRSLKNTPHIMQSFTLNIVPIDTSRLCLSILKVRAGFLQFSADEFFERREMRARSSLRDFSNRSDASVL